jgi:ABC-type uncharacterized transport system permease subunit
MSDIIIAILRSGTPLIYVTLAGVLAQRAGVWNLGLEGLMIIGACATVLGIVLTGSYPLAFAIAIVSCVLASILLWFVIEKLKANPIIAGLGLTGLGLGGTAFVVQAVFGRQAAISAPFGAPKIGDTFGAFGSLSIFVLLMPFVVFALWVVLCRTRFGLRLSACGEHPFAARSVGANPDRMRLIALAAGGVLCAAGGAELATGSLQIFSQNMTAGRGFMAFAAVIFGTGHPVWATFAALFFAIAGALGIRAQLAFGATVPHGLLQGLPYIATVFGVWLSGRMRGGAKAATLSGELRDG